MSEIQRKPLTAITTFKQYGDLRKSIHVQSVHPTMGYGWLTLTKAQAQSLIADLTSLLDDADDWGPDLIDYDPNGKRRSPTPNETTQSPDLARARE